MMVDKTTRAFNFEKSITELETIIEKMEEGGLPLEESLKQFEKGVSLTRQCQQALKKAEQKVKVLTEKQGKQSVEDYETDD